MRACYLVNSYKSAPSDAEKHMINLFLQVHRLGTPRHKGQRIHNVNHSLDVITKLLLCILQESDVAALARRRNFLVIIGN